MRKINILLLVIVSVCMSTAPTYAFDLESVLSGLSKGSSSTSSDTTSTNDNSSSSGSSLLSNILGSVLQSSSLEVSDIAGTWTVSGPAVQFQSDNLLEQAGGAVAASAIEEKLTTYYEKIGIDGMTMKITTEGEVTMTLKSGKSFSGTVTKGDEDGQMKFSFSKLTSAGLTVEVTKSGSTLSLLLDVSKLKSLLSLVSDSSSQLSTIASLLENYDGIYAGLKFTK